MLYILHFILELIFPLNLRTLLQRKNSSITDKIIPHVLKTARTPQKSTSVGVASRLMQRKDIINILITKEEVCQVAEHQRRINLQLH